MFNKTQDEYQSMEDGRKWRLSTGTVVEDTVFTYLAKIDQESPLLEDQEDSLGPWTSDLESEGTLENSLLDSWTLDLESDKVQQLFIKEELDEIGDQVVDTFDQLPEDWDKRIEAIEAQDIDTAEEQRTLLSMGQEGTGRDLSAWLPQVVDWWITSRITEHSISRTVRGLCRNERWVCALNNAMGSIPGVTVLDSWSQRLIRDDKFPYLACQVVEQANQASYETMIAHGRCKLAHKLRAMSLDISGHFGTKFEPQLEIQAIGSLELRQNSDCIIFGLQRKGYVWVFRRHLKMEFPCERGDIGKLIRMLKDIGRIRRFVEATQREIGEF